MSRDGPGLEGTSADRVSEVNLTFLGDRLGPAAEGRSRDGPLANGANAAREVPVDA